MDDPGEPIGAGGTQQDPLVVQVKYRRPPAWMIVFSAALVAFGVFGRQQSAPILTNNDRASGEALGEHHPRAPYSMPGRGWNHVLLRVYYGISDDRIMLIAGGVTFYAILALFPGIAAIVSVYGLFTDPSHIVAHLDTLSGFAPSGAVDVLREQLVRLAHQDRAALGFGFAVSLVFSLWTANAGVSGLFEALTAVYEEKEKRSLIKYYAVTLAFTAGTIVLVLLSLAILIALPLVINYIAHPGATAVLLKIIRWPILFVLVALAFALVYRFGPSRSAPRWRWITWGSAFAVIAWLAASALFSWYVANFGHYNRTYGSLGAIIGFMTWMWVSIIVVLVGAKLDAELERRTASVDAAGPWATRRSKTADRLDSSRE
jgi:membrane protein